MMWVVWRQQRSIVVAFFAAAVVFVIWLIVTGQHEQSLWNQYLAAPCKGRLSSITRDVNYCAALEAKCPSLVHTMTTSPRSLARFMPLCSV